MRLALLSCISLPMRLPVEKILKHCHGSMLPDARGFCIHQILNPRPFTVPLYAKNRFYL